MAKSNEAIHEELENILDEITTGHIDELSLEDALMYLGDSIRQFRQDRSPKSEGTKP